MYHDIFMANVLRLLDEKQLTKQSLAQKAGMSISFLSDLTNGKANPSLKIMAAIASALDTPLPDLLRTANAAPAAAEPPGQYRVVRRLPQGLTQVAAVLTDYQAFHVRQWDAANRKTMGKSEDSSA
ncbi:helix-turn-helix domain-containing protein (plasmid) [Comamonas antarctica]|uniref:Helix-turn-helix domain-containing protein n=2 Tax=Comamonas antarctica TaxID=2743470 RepID=A0A6N1X730_9BURK|nr:helix-turn-helix domain-containing protein [Comamonas antarctica]QKV55137.1 helix-turn-helix domain-containing protein [Comamonas antarctica]